MKFIATFAVLALSGIGLAAPKAQSDFIDEVQPQGPGYNILIAVETAPNKDKAIVAWAYGRFQCTERQLLSKGKDFCGKKLTFDRVPELDDENEASGGQEKVTVSFEGCGDESDNGDYSKIVLSDSTGYYRCNGDRELHGCDYNNSELDTDLAAFLSCGNYAYTPGDDSGDNDGPDEKPGNGGDDSSDDDSSDDGSSGSKRF